MRPSCGRDEVDDAALDAVRSDRQPRERDRQAEAARSRAAGVDVQDAAAALDERAVRVARDDHVDVVVAGHSHCPLIERRDGVLHVNPGSAGPRRFRLPIALARLSIGPHGIEGRIVDLVPPP